MEQRSLSILSRTSSFESDCIKNQHQESTGEPILHLPTLSPKITGSKIEILLFQSEVLGNLTDSTNSPQDCTYADLKVHFASSMKEEKLSQLNNSISKCKKPHLQDKPQDNVGSLFDILVDKGIELDEDLVRTYFV